MILGIVLAIVVIAVIIALVMIKSGDNDSSDEAEEEIVVSLDDDTIVKDENIGRYEVEDETIDIVNADYGTQHSDLDGDGIKNIDEHNAGTDMYNPDTDEDGLNDYMELKVYNTDPLKFSSRDDEVSDLDWILQDSANFTEGYVEDEMSGLWFYLSKPEHRAFDTEVVDTDKFDALDTISSIYEIKRFSGKLAFFEPVYTSEIYKHITVYAYRNDG